MGAEQTFVVDLTKPIFESLQLFNETDSGFDNLDRLTNLPRPMIELGSEPGLRFSIQHLVDDGNGGQTITEVPEDSYIILTDGSTGYYSFKFLDSVELSDGKYNIIIKDDAGNENLFRGAILHLLLTVRTQFSRQ